MKNIESARRFFIGGNFILFNRASPKPQAPLCSRDYEDDFRKWCLADNLRGGFSPMPSEARWRRRPG